jgi:hypothetical protein
MSRSAITSDKKTLLFPVLLITVGVGWLLTTVGVAPGIDWVWTLGLGIAGLMTLAIGGIDKVTVVIGPFFMTATCLSILRQTGRLSIDIEIPVLVIVTGVLLLIGRAPAIPIPTWAVEETRIDN